MSISRPLSNVRTRLMTPWKGDVFGWMLFYVMRWPLHIRSISFPIVTRSTHDAVTSTGSEGSIALPVGSKYS